MSRIIGWGWATALTVSLMAADLPAQEGDGPTIDFSQVVAGARAGRMGRGAPSPFQDFNVVTQGAEKIDGLFTLYKKGEHLYAEIPPNMFNQTFLVPVTIARGMASAGMPVGDDDMVLIFRRVGDRIQLVRRNIHFKSSGHSLDKAVQQNYTDSILMALPIVTINQMRGGAPLIDFTDIFMTDFAQLGLGMVDRSRSMWYKVKGFQNNVELEVETTFTGGGRRYSMMGMGSDGVADHRGITLVIHYSLMRTPDGGYHPRGADDRVGHFLSATKDFGATDPDSNFVRLINRWRLVKANPRAKLSPPQKQIVWYVEDTVPIEYRPYVEEGIREWNKAFEKIGFKDAIAVRWEQSGRDEFDPEDTNYCTFRWITSDSAYAMSCLRANPLTGEMIDGDVIFDSAFIPYWKQEYALLFGNTTAADGQTHSAPLAIGEVISPILASKMGFGQPVSQALGGLDALGKNTNQMTAELIPSGQNPLAWQLSKNQARGTRGFCQFQSGFQHDIGLAMIALAQSQEPAGDDKGKREIIVEEKAAEEQTPPTTTPPASTDKPKDKDKPKEPEKKEAEKKKPEPKNELPEEFIGQAIKHIVMHEVGHSLGLRHNFKSSTMLTADQLNDTTITHAKGLVGSVMDYSPVNIAPKGKKQGDYYSTTLGPYDYWAIEYAYKSADGDEASELKKIAARAPEHDLVYATDEDAMLNDDPYVNRWDLGSDPCEFGKERIALAADLLKNLDEKVVKDGESWARTRRAFSILLSQWGDGATLASQYIGGQSVSRDHKADKDARDPIMPIVGAKQRECLKFLTDAILSDKAFQFSPALLRRLGTERWMHWGSNSFAGPGVDISVLERILGIQKIVLGHALGAQTLARIENQQLQANPNTDPLRIDEVFRSLTDGIWSDLDKLPAGKDDKFALSTIRRNLQREYLRRLGGMVLGNNGSTYGDSISYVVFIRGGSSAMPADARALARLHLKEIASRINKVLETTTLKIDDTSRAHLEESRHRISKVLEANLDVREP
jgi:Met-zincin/Domain of unknown function (DUF5117)/Domain of unknown function (DUF5118)